MSSDRYLLGGTNSTDQVYPVATSIGGAAYTITNTGSGALEFQSGGATANYVYGNLKNSGTVSFVPSTRAGGATFNLGAAANTLTQTGGTIRFSQTDATSGPTVNLYYGKISNGSGSTISLKSAQAATFNATNVGDLKNDGTIDVSSISGGGFSSIWGNGSGTLTNNGTFSVDDSKATSGATVNFNFRGVTNNGTATLNLPAGSTSITTVGSGGFSNTGTWSVRSHGTGGGNIRITGGNGTYHNTGTINVDDASLSLGNPITGNGGVFNLSNGANVTLNGGVGDSDQTFNFSGADNTLRVPTGNHFTGVLRGFSQGDHFFPGVSGTPTYDTNTGLLTITENNGQAQAFDIGKGYTGTFSDSTADGVTYSGVTPCYLAGSQIRTRDGEKAVEAIEVGDELVTLDPVTNAEVVKAVAWVGSRKVTVDPSRTDDAAGYPVRVLKDALGAGVPHTDLLITAEHCLYLNGRFVPVRMLVNGRSIAYDKSMHSFEVYHVETEKHEIITANGVLSESFLDTENHGLFRRNGNVIAIGNLKTVTWDDAAAPLGVSRDFVEPLFHAFADRAIQAGVALRSEAPELTNDADLRLVTAAGTVIRPVRSHEDRVMFLIPADVNGVRIVSNASRPSDVIGPFYDDRRYFGVSVGRVTLFESSKTRALTAHLTDADLDGWNLVENGESRWTTGNAALSLGERTQGDAALLTVQIKAAGPYVVCDTAGQAVPRRA